MQSSPADAVSRPTIRAVADPASQRCIVSGCYAECVKLSLAGVALVASFAAAAAAPPRLADYPARTTFKGKPAVPVLATAPARMLRTELRRHAANGPDFAGHFTLASIGCGAECLYVAVIDAHTGEVFVPTISVEGVWNKPGKPDCHLSSRHELGSELFIAQGRSGDKVGRHYFHWKDGKFRLVHFEPTCTWPD